jgi:hypothetical protein
VKLDAPIERRTFLRGTGAALLALSRIGTLPSAVRAADAGVSLRVLSAGDARIFGAVADRMVFTADPNMPRFAETAGLLAIDAALLQLPAATVKPLPWVLRLFEYAPPIFAGRLSTFTGLDDEAKDSYLAGWAESRFEIRRLAFDAVKNLSMLGYYSQDSTWKGIHYDGPWIPRPRRIVARG